MKIGTCDASPSGSEDFSFPSLPRALPPAIVFSPFRAGVKYSVPAFCGVFRRPLNGRNLGAAPKGRHIIAGGNAPGYKEPKTISTPKGSHNNSEIHNVPNACKATGTHRLFNERPP